MRRRAPVFALLGMLGAVACTPAPAPRPIAPPAGPAGPKPVAQVTPPVAPPTTPAVTPPIAAAVMPTPDASSALLTEVVALAAANGETCAVRKSGAVVCWGYRVLGHRMNDNNDALPEPIQVRDLPAASQVFVGTDHSCALDRAGKVWCWGSNEQGELGRDPAVPAVPSALLPVPVLDAAGRQLTAKSLARSGGQGSASTCVVSPDDSVTCWGRVLDGPKILAPQRLVGLAGVTSLSLARTGCALTDSVLCWGTNFTGNLARPPAQLASSVVPVAIPLSTGGLVAVAVGDDQTCALDKAGDAHCWGGLGVPNGCGQKASCAPRWHWPDSATPLRVSFGAPAREIVLGRYTACALLRNGSVACLGHELDLGYSGRGELRTPRLVAGLRDAVAIVAGDHHTCALRKTGTVRCWGYGQYGELGGGHRNEESATGIEVVGPK